jgi:hypothetical protein
MDGGKDWLVATIIKFNYQLFYFSILVGWAIWVLILPNIIEIIDAVYGEKELGNYISINKVPHYISSSYYSSYLFSEWREKKLNNCE